VVNGELARLERADWIGAGAGAATEVWFRQGDAPPVRFLFEDALRPDGKDAVAALKARGFRLLMLTGDLAAPARRISEALGLEFAARLTPGEKIARLSALAGSGAYAAFVGDGLNDAPALASAHASLSPGGAADVAQAAADFVYGGETLSSVVEAVDTARQARRRMLENFAFAALYNFCAVPLAAAGFVTPLIAAAAMSGSSIVVTLNALRIAKARLRGRSPFGARRSERSSAAEARQ
jgi:Cu2+-exporting ATPase